MLRRNYSLNCCIVKTGAKPAVVSGIPMLVGVHASGHRMEHNNKGWRMYCIWCVLQGLKLDFIIHKYLFILLSKPAKYTFQNLAQFYQNSA
jgi:hypothetical protein